VERCNECRKRVLRFERKLCRFLMIQMKRSQHHIGLLRQSHILHFVTTLILGISTLISIPQVDIQTAIAAPRIQRILLPDSTPITLPSILTKSSPEYTGFFVIVLSNVVLEKHLHINTTLAQGSSDHARIFTSLLLYTQTTSSFL
jgi:hypothetical protein